jgi:hypothetical protein
MLKSAIQSFGIIVPSLQKNDQIAALAKNIIALLNHSYKYSPVLFPQEVSSQIYIPCCQLQQQHIWSFEHTLISTNITTTKILSECLRCPKKLFYVYDLEWITSPNKIYKEFHSIYNNPEISLIARTEADYKILENCWKKPIGIINDYNYEELIKYV